MIQRIFDIATKRYYDLKGKDIGGGNYGAFVVTYSAAHTHVHNGNFFSAGHYAEGIADNGTLDLLIRNSDGYELHIQSSGVSGGNAVMEITENISYSSAGTALSIFNHKRSSSNTPSVLISHTPTLVSGTGTALPPIFVAGGLKAAGSGGAVHGALGGGSEWNFKANTNYLIRMTNIAGAVQVMGLTLSFYQVPVGE